MGKCKLNQIYVSCSREMSFAMLCDQNGLGVVKEEVEKPAFVVIHLNGV